MLKSKNVSYVDQSIVEKCVNYYNTIPGEELVNILLDKSNTFKNFKLGVEDAKISIKKVDETLKDIQYGLNKIFLEVTFNVCHTRGINLTSVKANIKTTVKYNNNLVMTVEFDSYASGVSVVDKTELLMEYALVFGKGFLRNINFTFTPHDFKKQYKKIIETDFPTNLTELESIRRRDNYDGYLSHFSNVKTDKGDTIAEGPWK